MALVAVIVVIGIAVVMLGGGSLLSANLSAQDIAGYAQNAGWSGTDLEAAVAIALAESGGNPSAVGDQALAPTNGPSIGLWQINTAKHKDFTADQLTDPQTNAQAAYLVWQRAGGSFQPWTTWTNGAWYAHKADADAGIAALNAGSGDQSA